MLADGPPERATLYDNNAYQDFHAVVPKNVPNDFYWKELEEQIYRKFQDERETKEEAARNKASNVLNRSKLIYNYIDNQGIEHFLEDIMYLTCKKESKN